MNKVKSNYKLKISSDMVVTLLIIGLFFSPIFTSIQIVSAPDGDGVPMPSIDLEKYVWDGSTYQDADLPTGPYLSSFYDPVIFKFTIHNDGAIDLLYVNLTDTDMTSFYDNEACTDPAEFPTTLNIGETKTYYGKLSWAAGQHNNTATADEICTGVSDIDWANYFGATYTVDLEKYVFYGTYQDADVAPGPTIPGTADVLFKFTIHNTGDSALTGVVLTDTPVIATFYTDELCTVPAVFPTTLGVGETKTYYAKMPWASGAQYDNACVTSTEGAGDCDPANYFGESCECQPEVWIDDNFDSNTPGWLITHFNIKQMALDSLESGGTAYVYGGIYYGDIIIDDIPCCDNTGITQKGEYGCFPIDESAVITGSEIIKVNDVTIKYLEYTPNINGSIIVFPDVCGTIIRCNKFNKDCIDEAIGVKSYSDCGVNAEFNWWGVPDGPNGGNMDDGAIADGQGVKVIGDVDVEPWLGIHAEINQPDDPTTVKIGEPVHFDASGSFAYSFGECCQNPEELPMQYLWNFGDGKFSSNLAPIHIFYEPGTYEVTLTVDAPGIPGLYANIMYDWAYVTIHVVTEDTTLTANADGGNLGGYETIVNEPIQLNGDAYGGNGEYTWHWNFGDQTADSNMQNPIHTYTQPGTYTATLTVISDGETATDIAEVRVYDIDELFVTINDANTMTGIETMFTASINGGTPPYTINWDFGDGSTSQENSPTHIYNNPGIYTVTVTVTDNKQKTATDTAKITVDEENIIQEAEIKDVKGGLGIKATIDAGDNECYWEISIDGKYVLSGGEKSGTINPNEQKTVKLGYTTRAYGRVYITVTAEYTTKEYKAFALGPFYFNLKEL